MHLLKPMKYRLYTFWSYSGSYVVSFFLTFIPTFLVVMLVTHGAVPVGMKLAILFYFAAFFGTFAAGFAYLGIPWVKGVFRLDPACWAWGCFGASGVLVQVADRLPSWLDHRFGLDKHAVDGITPATSLCTCLEEGGELMIAVFALLTIQLAHRAKRKGAV